MGCVGSRQGNKDKKHRDEDTENTQQTFCKNTTTSSNEDSQRNVSYQPKVSMMEDHTLKLLKEIGELKSFTEVDPAELSRKKVDFDFIMALENPQAAANNATTRST